MKRIFEDRNINIHVAVFPPDVPPGGGLAGEFLDLKIEEEPDVLIPWPPVLIVQNTKNVGTHPAPCPCPSPASLCRRGLAALSLATDCVLL